VAGTFLGTLIVGVLANILNLTGVDPFVQQLFKGERQLSQRFSS
jgi:ribose/xylose/arabinose/galactoside ABC-type transport system permease subunit